MTRIFIGKVEILKKRLNQNIRGQFLAKKGYVISQKGVEDLFEILSIVV